MLTILLLPVALYQGCRAPSTAHPSTQREGAAWDEPVWGPVTRGLQCRLRPAKRLLGRYEIPTFRVDIRNLGKRVFAFPGSQPLSVCEISVDGGSYHRPDTAKADGSLWPLAPGVTFENILIPLDGPLDAGRHIVQVTFELEGVRVVSNPVGIEILEP